MTQDAVGPVLETGRVAEAIIAAIQASNAEVVLVPRGGYTRILVPRRCTVSRAIVEEHLGRSIEFRRELEKAMPSFKGTFVLTDDYAEWSSHLDLHVDRTG
jgi:hypothetical protein